MCEIRVLFGKIDNRAETLGFWFELIHSREISGKMIDCSLACRYFRYYLYLSVENSLQILLRLEFHQFAHMENIRKHFSVFKLIFSSETRVLPN